MLRAEVTCGEVLPGVHRIAEVIEGRLLYTFFLAGKDCGVLVDAGEPATPARTIFPYLESMGMAPDRISLVVITHADTDHHGGVSAVQAINPHATIGCGSADRSMIQAPEILIRSRYRAYEAEHGIGYSEDLLEHIRRALTRCRVDVTYHGGELISIEDGWELEIVSTPGHSPGHISVYDRRHRVLYAGDAVHGGYYPDVSGAPLLPPNYVDLSAYRATIAKLRKLEITSLHTAHWPEMIGDEVICFLAASRDYTDHIESIIVAALSTGKALTLGDAVRYVRTNSAAWNELADIDLAYSVEAHLRDLESRSELVLRRRSRPRIATWQGIRRAGRHLPPQPAKPGDALGGTSAHTRAAIDSAACGTASDRLRPL